MSVYKRPDSPYYQYDFQDNHARFHGSTKETTRRKAEQVEAEIKARARAQTNTGGKRNCVTLDQATGEFWLNVGRYEKNHETTWGQLATLNRIIGAGTFIHQIDDPAVGNFVARRRGETHAKYKKRKGVDIPLVSPATVNRETALLGRVIKRAAKVKRARLPDEPDRPDFSAHKLAEPAPPDRPLTLDQEARLFDELVAHAKPIVDVALLTGLRLSQILNLDCADINFSTFKGRVRRKTKKPGDNYFTFEITEALIEILAPHVQNRTCGAVWRFGPPCDCAVCRKRTSHGKPITSIRTAFEGARKRAGVPDFRFHDLRHTVGSRVMALTGNLKAAQDILDHQDISTTTRYAHHAPGALADVQRQLSKMRRADPEHITRTKTADKSRVIPEVTDLNQNLLRKNKG